MLRRKCVTKLTLENNSEKKILDKTRKYGNQNEEFQEGFKSKALI